MKFIKLFFILFVLILVLGFVESKSVSVKISPEIVEKVNQGEKDIKVVIKLKENKNIKSSFSRARIEEKNKYKNYVSKNVTLGELEELKNDENVEMIFKSHEIKAFLSETVQIVNSSLTNSLTVSGINLTGTGQTVCVIDSGVDFNHPDLIGKNNSCIIDCFDRTCVENCSAEDESGHGTHVAGIVAASGSLFGISNNVSLIGVKILDENGYGSGNDWDLSRAIDYCVSQNVDVITMSLGTSTLYNSDCSALMSPWTDSINDAFAENISLIAATGNDGNWSHISSPACIGNVTPVGDTYDANFGGINWVGTCTDSSTFVDKIVCHANRNNMLQLFAPGALINSTYLNKDYTQLGGTSMATPVVAGAFAILHQVLELSGQNKNGLEIENIFNSTGKTINDATSGLSFSRIDVYDAVLSLDTFSPNVSLNSPLDNHINLTQNHSFNCNVSDWQLSNVSFYLWNSTGLYYNQSLDIIGETGNFYFNVSGMINDNYKWNCFVYDVKSNLGFAESNFSLVLGGVSVLLDLPENNSYFNSEINFSCNSSSSNALSNVSFYLWNSTGLYYNQSWDISGVNNQSFFNYTILEEGVYDWNCFSFDSSNNSSWASLNRTIGYDINNPNVSLISPAGSSSYTGAQSIILSYNVSDNYEIANCSLIVGGLIVSTNFSINKSLNHSFVYSFGVGSHSWSINCSDDAGNIGNSSSRSLVVNAASVIASSGSSGGGGGGSSSKIYVVNAEQASKSYTNKLAKNDRIKFTFFDADKGEHYVIVNSVNSNSVDLTIQSEPIKLKLGIGQSAKLNLTSKNVYDLYVKLNAIVNGKAELIIQTINEEVYSEGKVISGKVVDDVEKVDEEVISDEEMKLLISEIQRLRNIIYFLVVVIIFIIIFLLNRSWNHESLKNLKKKVKEGFLKNLLDLK